MKKIKIDKKYWDLIVSGVKTKEYRKLEKGITTGEYLVVNLETSEKLGTVTLTPWYLYPIEDHNENLKNYFEKYDWDFLKVNYLKKHDFVEYWITGFKEIKEK